MTMPRAHTHNLERPSQRRFALMSAATKRTHHGRAAVHDVRSAPPVVPMTPSPTEENARTELVAELKLRAEHFVRTLSSEVETLRTELSRSGVHADFSLQRIQTLVAGLADQLETIGREHQPPPIAEVGLEQTLAKYCQQVCNRTSVELSYESQVNEHEVDPSIALTVFRVAQDALDHAAKYRRPSFVSVRVLQEGPGLQLSVEDLGEEPPVTRNVELDTAEQNFLQRMEERASHCGGQLQVTHKPGATLLALQVPVTLSRNAVAA